MQPQDKPNLHYPKMKYHWIQNPVIVNNADEGTALGGGWADTPAAFAPYRGPRPPRTAGQKAIKWVDDWPVPAVMSDHRQGIKIELLRADVAFWKSPDTPDAHHTAMRLAFEGVAMVLFAAGPDGCRGCETSGDRKPPHRSRLATIHGRCPSSQADRCKFPGNGSQYPLRARRTVRH